ncbi:MAG: hypothetical protein KGL26_01045 [Pseudomonadota bacterium]|nr:hypothetical protein [Pseudomonadota bacterium]
MRAVQMGVFTELQQYECHKKVRAGRIARINLLPTGDYEVHCQLADGRSEHFEVPAQVFARSFPKIGDYLVHYEDGYLSWSPAEVFESGYKAVRQAPAPVLCRAIDAISLAMPQAGLPEATRKGLGDALTILKALPAKTSG